MRWHIHRPAVLAASSVLFALAVGYAVADEPPNPREGNPDAGLTNEEVVAKHAALSARSDAFQRAKAAEFNREGRDPSKLERGGMFVDFQMYGDSLEADASLATLVVEAVVTHLTLVAPTSEIGLTESTITVIDALKGDVRGPIRLVQSGGIGWLDEEGGEPILGEPEAMPLVLKGERVILLLLREPLADDFAGGNGEPAYAAVPWRGIYWVEGTRIRTFEANPEYDEVNGMSVADFKSRLRAAVR